MKNTLFYKQSDLLLRALPYVDAEKCFALKGGTAINFFVRNLPRLSVDIDLTYLPIEPREQTLKNINNALKRIASKIRIGMANTRVMELINPSNKLIMKLVVQAGETQIKIEPNLIFRGTIFPIQEMPLVEKAEQLFELALSTQVVSASELYAGKICAALDRQHPRDLFDIKILLDHEGITPEIISAFVVYLASNPRPMNELLMPNSLDMKQVYETEFQGMTFEKVDYEHLCTVRKILIEKIHGLLKSQEKRFLVSLKSGDPEWPLLGIQGLEKFPAVQWKLMNIKKMDKKKHKQALEKLKVALSFE